MFNLEQAIVEWRRQMLAAGIKTPVPLEELESHLREDIKQQIQTGKMPQEAFESASAQMGEALPLNLEFKKAGGFHGWLGENKAALNHRLLALLWLAFCTWIFLQFAYNMTLAAMLIQFKSIHYDWHYNWDVAVLWEIIFLCGMIASISFFGGKKKGVWVIRLVAILVLMAIVGGVVQGSSPPWKSSLLTVAVTVLCVASIWLLRPSKLKALSQAAK